MKEFRNTGYYVKSDGTIQGKNKILKPTLTPYGYHSVCLYFNGAHKTFLVHRMVAECYLDNPENKPEVNHDNGNKIDNRVENLIWATSKENINHAIKTLGQRKLGQCPNSKLTYQQMCEIYKCFVQDNIYQTELAKKYNVDRSTIVRTIKRMKNEMKF